MGRGDQEGLLNRHGIVDRREQMDIGELLEELELAHPEEVADFERRHSEAMEAVEMDDLDSVDPELLDDLRDDLVSRLRV